MSPITELSEALTLTVVFMTVLAN